MDILMDDELDNVLDDKVDDVNVKIAEVQLT